MRTEQSRYKILIVEDDVSLCRLWQRLLNEVPECDYQIFHSPIDAMGWFTKSPADILLTDVNLPGMSGLDLIKKITHENPQTRVIATSAYCANLEQFENTGTFLHLIPKPYKSLSDIKEFIRLFLQNSIEISGVEDEEESSMYLWDL